MPDRDGLHPAVFLDRDGTICDEVGYLNHVSRFRLFPFAAEAIRRLNAANWPVVVVTNQSGVARGYFPESLVREVHELMNRQLEEQGAHLTGVYYCPHGSSDQCGCRKPKLGLLEQAAREHSLDLKRSVVVGDRFADIALARNAGAKALMVRSGYGAGELQWHAANWPTQPDFVAANLADAVDWILNER